MNTAAVALLMSYLGGSDVSDSRAVSSSLYADIVSHSYSSDSRSRLANQWMESSHQPSHEPFANRHDARLNTSLSLRSLTLLADGIWTSFRVNGPALPHDRSVTATNGAMLISMHSRYHSAPGYLPSCHIPSRLSHCSH